MPKDQIEDSDLAHSLRACLEQGGADRWERFIRLAHPTVSSAVLRAISFFQWRDRQIADDLIQDVFLRVCRNDFHALRGFRAEESKALRVWLRTVSGNVVASYIDHAKAETRGGRAEHVSMDEPAAAGLPSGDSPLHQAEGKILAERVKKCLDEHEPRDRRIFWLYHLHAFKPRVIAEYPGINLEKDGVETVVYRVTRAVRRCLEDHEVFPPKAEGARS